MEKHKFKIRLTFGSQIWQRLIGRVNWLLVSFGIRKKRKFWGIVYDSVSKQPLDPVLVTLAYADGGFQTCITDMDGNYGFLAHEGKFKILAKKTNYSFPSKRVSGHSDGIYRDLYHGEFFTLDDYEVVAPNIPMDAENFDWNQQAKLKFTYRHALREYAFRVIVGFLFWGLLILLCVSVWAIAFRPWAGWPNLGQYFYLYLGAAFYVLMFFLAAFTPEIRLWGKITYTGPGERHLLAGLTMPEIPGVIFGTSEVQKNGMFLLRANPGQYKLVIKEKKLDQEATVLGNTTITIGPERVVNQSFKLIDGGRNPS